MSERPLSVPDALIALRKALHSAYGCWPLRLQVFIAESVDPIALLFPLARGHGQDLSRSTSLEKDELFVATAFQQAILDALEARALRTDALGQAVGDRSRLFKRNGLAELRERGLVSHHKRLGYYRPDAPPDELASDDEE